MEMSSSSVVKRGRLQVNMELAKFGIDAKALVKRMTEKQYKQWKLFVADLIRSDLGLDVLGPVRKKEGKPPKEKKEKSAEPKPRARKKKAETEAVKPKA